MMNSKRRKIMARWLCGAALVVVVGLQMVRPAIDNPPVRAELQAPPEVKAILKHSCYSCHSNETKLSWFDQVVPAYWMVSRDVRRARKHVNFSEIAELSIADQRTALFDAVNQIQLGAMPLPTYRRVHPGSGVTPAELAVLRNYVMTLTVPPPHAAGDGLAAHSVQPAGITELLMPKAVSNTQDGVPFDPDYKNWKQISISERLDNDTIRVVLGNDVAITAIAHSQTHPWPDGTKIAKATWYEQTDGTGLERAGKFVQVEMMTRDHARYRSTSGWGWGRWLGPGLTVDSKTSDVQNACIDCHSPMRKNDYVFTMPIKGQQ